MKLVQPRGFRVVLGKEFTGLDTRFPNRMRFPKRSMSGRMLTQLNEIGAKYHKIAKANVDKLQDYIPRIRFIGRWAKATTEEFKQKIAKEFEGDEIFSMATDMAKGLAASYFRGNGDFENEITKGLNLSHFSEDEQMAMLEASVTAKKSKI